MRNLIFAVAIAFLGQACTTITFVRDPNSTRTNYSEWHHDWLFGLLEGSDPVDLNARCNGSDWKTVRTEQSFVQGLVTALTNSLYNPHGVEFSCSKVASAESADAPAPSTPRGKQGKRN